MNVVDIVVVVVMVLSAGFAYMRGLTRELLAIVAWLGAAVIAFYTFIFAVPFAERFLPKGPMADIAAGAAIFVIALIVLSIVTSSVARRVSQSGMSAFDRLFGLIFGLVRGAVLVSLGYIALTWYLPPNKPQPPWVTESRARPLLEAGANAIESLIPSRWRDQVKTTASQTAAPGSDNAGGNEADNAARALVAPKSAATPATPAPSYKIEDRAGMDRLINQEQDKQ